MESSPSAEAQSAHPAGKCRGLRERTLCPIGPTDGLYSGHGDLCRNVYQQLSKLGSLELQAVLNKMLDEVATPIKFCQYKLHGPSGADSGLKVPDSPSGKLIQVWSLSL